MRITPSSVEIRSMLENEPDEEYLEDTDPESDKEYIVL